MEEWKRNNDTPLLFTSFYMFYVRFVPSKWMNGRASEWARERVYYFSRCFFHCSILLSATTLLLLLLVFFHFLSSWMCVSVGSRFLLYFCFYYYYYVFFVLNFCFGCISCCCCGGGCWLYSIVFYISIDLNCIHRSPSDQHLGHNRHSSGHCCNKCCKIVCILGALIHKHAVA